jgi:hypothetical protein
MAQISQRSRKWCVRIRNGGYRIIETFQLKQDAETFAREWARKIESDVVLKVAHKDPGRRIRFQEVCDLYMDREVSDRSDCGIRVDLKPADHPRGSRR